jgi:hypothetical protein
VETLQRARRRAGLALLPALAAAVAGCATMSASWVAPALPATTGGAGPASSAPSGGGGAQPVTSPGNSSAGQPGTPGSGGGQPGSNPLNTPASTPTPPGGTGPSIPGSSAQGVLFGGDLPLAAEEPQLGRRLAIVRIYDVIGDRFPTRREAQLMAQGTTVLVSLDTFPPHGPSYASIAAGREDGTIRSFLESVERAAVTYHLSAIYVTFEHEADNISRHQGLGSPAQFVQAWDHIHQLAVSAHLDWNQGGRIHWAMILMHHAYINGSAASYWPGAGEADVVGVDGYNSGDCRGGGHSRGQPQPVSPASIFAAAVSFAAAHGHLPVFIAEWGSVAYSSPSVRVSFIQQMQAFVAANPEIAAAMYWDSQARCNYVINNSPSSLAALASMGRAPNMQGNAAS